MKFSPWELNPDVRRKAEASIAESVFKDLPQGDVKATVDAVGKDELIRQMAGTADKKSKEWKSKRDGITRWLKGSRKPKAESVAKVDNAAKSQRVNTYRQRGSVAVAVVGNWQTSKSTWKGGRVHANLTGQAKENFLDALERGDTTAALQIACAEYGLDPDVVENLDDIQDLTVE